MALTITTNYQKAPNFLWLFWSNRFLRLFPIYWLVLILTFVLCFIAMKWPHLLYPYAASNPLSMLGAKPVGPATEALLLFSQPTLIGIDLFTSLGWSPSGSVQFMTNFSAQPGPWLVHYLLVPQAWTISMEIYFYLLAPFLVPRKSLVAALLILTFAARLIAYRHGYFIDPFGYRFFPFELQHFLAGICSFYAYDFWRSRNPRAKVPMPLAVTVGAAVIFYCAIYSDLPWTRVEGFFLKQWAFLAAIPLIVPLLFHATRNNKIDRFIGELSYPLYIGHMLVAWSVLWIFGVVGPNFDRATVIASLLAAVPLALLQRRIDRWRSDRVKHSESHPYNPKAVTAPA